MRLIGFVLFGHDNGGCFFHDTPRGVLCEHCSGCVDPDYAPPNLKIDIFYDLSMTYDNRLICSQRAKDFFEERFDVQVCAVGVWRGTPLYYVSPLSTICFNTRSRGTKFVDYCSVCGSFKSIAGATPAHLAVNDLPARCFFKTDVAFGCFSEKSPLNVVGVDTAIELQDRGFPGCVFHDAYSAI